MSELKVSKLDAARRQLETAIRLYFAFGDPISVHNLAAAAHGLLHDLNTHRGGKPMILPDIIDQCVKSEYREAIRTKIREAQNFAKHADKDPAAILTFRPAQSEILLLDACWKYSELAGEQVPLFSLFVGWYVMLNRESFGLPEQYERLRETFNQDYSPRDRIKYFHEMLPILTANRGSDA